MADTRPTAENDEERAQREREQRERSQSEQEKRQREQRQRQAQADATTPPLTKAQQEAIANAPVVAVPEPPQPTEEVSEEQLAAQQAEAIANAPVVAVPEPPPADTDDDIASATVVTKQPTGETDVTTVPDEGTKPVGSRRSN